MLKVGDKAPDFSLEDAEGKRHGLDDFKGKKLVLYFYPKDDTPGCTTEACGFRDLYAEIAEKGAAVAGVSPDTGNSHRAFRDKFSLPFILLADPEKKAIEAYGAWGEKKMGGKTFQGVVRTTYVIDEGGGIVRIFPKVDPKGHAAEILALL
jgi:thioredoxin-dependent peroxiredoxin